MVETSHVAQGTTTVQQFKIQKPKISLPNQLLLQAKKTKTTESCGIANSLSKDEEVIVEVSNDHNPSPVVYTIWRDTCAVCITVRLIKSLHFVVMVH